jgi:hypothetical protein
VTGHTYGVGLSVKSAAGIEVSWETLLAEFLALGGIAENITLRQGPLGRGVFPVDPVKPVLLRVPPNLLVPTTDVELRDGNLVTKASSTLGERERAFFDRYQREMSWGAGLSLQLWQAQREWNQLPQAVQTTLREIGWIVGLDSRFSEPSEDLCFERYMLTRQIQHGDGSFLMPMLELVNHNDRAEGFSHGDRIGNGLAVSGVFEGEVLVKYNVFDCWGMALFHGFCHATDYALSLAFSCQSDNSRVEIHYDCNRYERYKTVALPVVRVEEDGTVDFSFLMLGHVRYPRLPRAIFHHVTKDTPIKRPDELFDLIQHYNRMQLLKFLRVSEGAATPLVDMLRGAAYHQLAGLSNHWGAGTL